MLNNPIVRSLTLVGVLVLGSSTITFAQTQACCEFGGVCNDRTEFECANAGGTPQGPGTACLGDSNGNSIDDACETQACCGVGKTGCEDRLLSECGGKGGGEPQGPGTICLGDNNQNGTDDACEVGGTIVATWIATEEFYVVPGAWDIGVVPCNGGGDVYEVVIDNTDANAIIQNSSCSVEALTLGAQSALFVNGGGGYAVNGGGAIHGQLTVLNSQFVSNTSTNIDEASFLVDGGTLSILGASEYTRTTNGPADQEPWQTNNGLLDLGSLTSISQPSEDGLDNGLLNIQATNGGTIDLGSVTTIHGGPIRVSASGTGSSVSLSSLTEWIDDSGITGAELSASSGGTVSSSNLTTLVGVDIAHSSTGALDVAQISTFRKGVFRLFGGSATLTAAVDIDSAGFEASSSGSLIIPSATEYARHATSNSDARSFRASGGTSHALRFPALAAITQTQTGFPDNSPLSITAQNSGTVGLPALTTIDGGAVQVSADGAGCVVDLSQLSSWSVTNPMTPSWISATSGGLVRLYQLSAVSGVDVTLDSTSEIACGPLTLTDSTVDYDGGDFGPGLVHIFGGALHLGTTSPSSLTEFRLAGIANYSGDVPVNVNVELSNVNNVPTVVTTNSDFKNFGLFEIHPNGAPITLITPGGWIDNRPNATLEIGAGQGNDVWFNGAVLNSGDCLVSTTLSNVIVGTNGVDHINDGLFEVRTYPTTSAVLVGSTFINDEIGDMVLGGNVDATGLSGFINAGTLGFAFLYNSDQTYELSLDGNLTQAATGSMAFDIAGHALGDEYDTIQATGTVTLAGAVEALFIDGFDPPTNSSYEVIGANQINGTFDTETLPAVSAPRCVDLVYESDSVSVVVTVAGIAADPQDQLACEGGVATLSVTPSGIGDISYQWRKGGIDLPGENNQTLAIDPVAPGDAGAYDVIVTSACGASTSATAMLNVGPGVLGDLNFDCAVTVADVPPFVACLGGPDAGIPVGCDRADFDVSAHIDLRDFQILQTLIAGGLPAPAQFVACITGPGGGLNPGCASSDLDTDFDVDLADFGLFQIGQLP